MENRRGGGVAFGGFGGNAEVISTFNLVDLKFGEETGDCIDLIGTNSWEVFVRLFEKT